MPEPAEALSSVPQASATEPSSGSAAALRPVPVCVTWVAVLIVVMVGKVSDWVPGLSSVPLAKIAFLIAAFAAFRGQAALAPVQVRKLALARPALAFMGLALLSITVSIYKSATLNMSLTILILMLSLTLLLKTVQTMRDFDRILLGFVCAFASLTLGTLLNFRGGRANINGNFDPNDIAYALDSLLPLMIVYAHWRTGLARLALVGLALLGVVAILLTGSRGGAIGLLVVALGAAVFPLRKGREGVLVRFSLGSALVRLAGLLIVGAMVWSCLPTETRERMATLLDLGSDYNNDTSLKGSRIVIWRKDIAAALKRPIGYGLGSAELVDGLNGGQYRTSHNSVVEAFVELGFLGLGLFVYTYVSSWKNLRALQLRAGKAAGPFVADGPLICAYARSLRLALLANFAAAFFLSNAYSPVLWLLVASAAAIVHISDVPLAGRDLTT